MPTHDMRPTHIVVILLICIFQASKCEPLHYKYFHNKDSSTLQAETVNVFLEKQVEFIWSFVIDTQTVPPYVT